MSHSIGQCCCCVKWLYDYDDDVQLWGKGVIIQNDHSSHKYFINQWSHRLCSGVWQVFLCPSAHTQSNINGNMNPDTASQTLMVKEKPSITLQLNPDLSVSLSVNREIIHKSIQTHWMRVCVCVWLDWGNPLQYSSWTRSLETSVQIC